MAGLSAYAQNAVLKWLLTAQAVNRPVVFYAALGTGADASGLTGEPAGMGYARQAVAFSAIANQASSVGALVFGPATASWGSLSHGAIFDALTGGNMLWWGPLQSPRTIALGDTYEVPASGLVAST